MGIKVKIRLPKIEPKTIQSQIDAAVIRAEKNIIAKEFKQSIDPYGKKWQPKKRSNGKPTLIDTGRMRKSFSYQRRSIKNKMYYSLFHQNGTKKMVRRAIFPYKGLKGSWWLNSINRSIKIVLDKNGLKR